MNVSIQACFDHGSTYGVDDAVFQEWLSRTPEDELRLLGVHAAEGDIGFLNKLGNGLQIEILDVSSPDMVPHDRGSIVESWRAEAIKYEEKWRNEPEKEDRHGYELQLAELLATQLPTRCYCIVYAIGTVFLRMDFQGFPNAQQHLAIPFYTCYEFAGYGPSTTKNLLMVVRTIMQRTGLKTIPEVARQEPPPEERAGQGSSTKWWADQINSFDLILSIDQHNDRGQLLALLQDYDDSGPLVEIHYLGHLTLQFRWAAKLIESNENSQLSYERRLFYSMQLAAVFLATCETFERLFLDKITARIQESNTNGIVEPLTSLRRMRLFAQGVSEMTDFDVVTPTGVDRRFFRMFEAAAGLGQRRERIRRLADLLRDVGNDVVEEQRQEREHRLTWFLTILTIFLLMSVAADLLGGIEFSEMKDAEWWRRSEWLFGAAAGCSVLVGAIIFYVLPRLHYHSRNRRADE